MWGMLWAVRRIVASYVNGDSVVAGTAAVVSGAAVAGGGAGCVAAVD